MSLTPKRWDNKNIYLGLAFVLMLRPFFPELVMSTDLLSFEHSSVLLFCFNIRIFMWYQVYINNRMNGIWNTNQKEGVGQRSKESWVPNNIHRRQQSGPCRLCRGPNHIGVSNDSLLGVHWLKLVHILLNYRILGTSTAAICRSNDHSLNAPKYLGWMSCLISFVLHQLTCQERIDNETMQKEKFFTVGLEPTTLISEVWCSINLATVSKNLSFCVFPLSMHTWQVDWCHTIEIKPDIHPGVYRGIERMIIWNRNGGRTSS